MLKDGTPIQSDSGLMVHLCKYALRADVLSTFNCFQ